MNANNYNKENRLKKAKVLREAAKKVLDQGLRTWKGEPDMISMVRGDAADMRKVAQFIRTNKMKEAENHAQCMDTAARERIPDEVWYWLTRQDGDW